MKATSNIPFELLPYQCFQEARTYLQQDRTEKLDAIQVEKKRIEKLQDTVAVGEEAESRKEQRLHSMRQRIERLKLMADINDPMVKKNFEDGKGTCMCMDTSRRYEMLNNSQATWTSLSTAT